jgi:CheY-like chemotaxis protein
MMVNDSFEPVTFLIVDDDDVSIMAIQRAMKKLKIINPVQIARDGIEALEVLSTAVGDSNQLPPYVVTLDLNMPRMSGIEFLEHIRQDPLLNRMVVFVLTSSDSPADIVSAYDKNIAGYIVKESPTESFAEALSVISDYANLVVLPK